MKVICFRGTGNRGKSETLKKILNEFFNIYLIPAKKRDFSLYFMYKGKKIGICSYGDDENSMLKFLKPLKEAGCDIIICASRTKGKPFEFVEKEFDRKDIEDIDCPYVLKSKYSQEKEKRFSIFKIKFAKIFKGIEKNG